MQNVLTVQALTAAKQRNNALALSRDYTPFGDARPSFDYVKKGDVIRVSLAVYASGVASLDVSAFRNRLSSNNGLALLQIDTSDFRGVYVAFTGHLIVDVQARGDFAKLNDVVGLVAGIAQASGLSVVIADTRGEFVSRVEDTGGTVPSTIPPPKVENKDQDKLTSFVKELTDSPVSLAVIVGGAVLLFVALKSR